MITHYKGDEKRINEVDLGRMGEMGEIDEIDLGVTVTEQIAQTLRTDAPFEARLETTAHELRQLEALQPEQWQTLIEAERLAILQEVELIIAKNQGRPPVEVHIEPNASSGLLGIYSPSTNQIAISQTHLNNDNVQKVLETLAHESRHAYQYYAVDHLDFHPDAPEVEVWRENMANYLDAEMYGQKRYERQPIEIDARRYGREIVESVYDEIKK
ncbi:MAG: hypothetical protein KDJ52_09875 [Anaerolineae bacterium]|nr:hypothetical protein [Anaerolineae bacterium]